MRYTGYSSDTNDCLDAQREANQFISKLFPEDLSPPSLLVEDGAMGGGTRARIDAIRAFMSKLMGENNNDAIARATVLSGIGGTSSLYGPERG